MNWLSPLIYDEYKDWANIDEVKAIELLNEIKENIGDDSILGRNSEALEKRYNKTSGTYLWLLISKWIQKQRKDQTIKSKHYNIFVKFQLQIVY